MNEIWTIGRLLKWTTDLFTSRHIQTPRLDAEILLSHSLCCSRLDLYLDILKPVTEEERVTFRKLVKLRTQRMPVAYLTGVKEFWSLGISVNRHVLIPRPETEKLVEVALDYARHIESPAIAELGTGSGCIAIALASELPGARIWALDDSVEALEIAKQNVVKFDRSSNITLINDSWRTFSFDARIPSLHAFISNPPYIPTAQLRQLAPEITRFEPCHALDGGEHGLDNYPFLCRLAMEQLVSGGLIAVEIGMEQGRAVQTIFEDHGFEHIQIVPDETYRDRVVIGFKK